jgi:hypothetical protein
MKLIQYITNLPIWLRFVGFAIFMGAQTYSSFTLLLSLFTYHSNAFALMGAFCALWLFDVALGGVLLYKLKLFVK